MLPDSVSGSGSVISSGACDAISAIALSADATVTSPAPARSAASPAIAAAPVLPRDPATTSTWPNVPLCPAGRARRQQLAEHRRLHQREPRRPSYNSGGLPIAPTISSPMWSQFGGIACATFGAVKVTV